MKKVILLLIGAAFSVAVANAQTDSVKSQSQPSKQTTKSQSTAYQSFPTKDMKKVSQNEIPASLRTTLEGSEYKGWENGTIYFNSATNEYAWQSPQTTGGSISATTAGKKDSQTWYRFDSNGKRIPDQKE